MRKKMMQFFHKSLTALILFSLVITALIGCGGDAQTQSQPRYLTNSQSAITQVLNWYPEPEHGGLYAAQMKDLYKQEGLNVTIQPGAPQVSPLQIVVAGHAQFGLADASELLMARQEGLPVVALAAFFQTTPQALIYHKSQDIKDFKDLNGRKVYVSPGARYWQHIKKKYELDQVQELKYNGQFANFMADETSVVQGYLTSEPFILAEQGVKTDWLPVSESGYAPYQSVLFTTEGFLKQNPDVVKKYVQATIEGWRYYMRFSGVVNPYIQQFNPDVKLSVMNATAKAQKNWILRGEAETQGIGYMTKERWAQTQQQLIEMGEMKKEVDLDKVFTTEYLPE